MGKGKVWYKRIRLEENGCWSWLGPPGVGGYGRIWFQGKSRYAHRFVYELLKEKIPKDCDVHHVCNNRLCVNPWHLEPLAKVDHRYLHAGTTHCKRGHPITEENTYRYANGYKRCRVCARERKRGEYLTSASE